MKDKERVRELFRQMDTVGFHKYGCLRFHSGSYEHAKAMFDKCWELFKLGHKFATEVKMKNGDTYDVVDLTTGEHWEFETNKKEDKHRGERVQVER